ncbi:hypothetical protein E8E14_009098 [Neopestalotiopsis sp. 37M]|nr:hypothetical protein E8E14_009098 [Neopestalotiopsis sp. 37M]
MVQITKAHAETCVSALRQLIRDHPLGVLTTAIPSSTHAFIQSSHIPWILDVKDESSETELGVLRGHLARGNPQSKTMIESLSASDRKETEVNKLEQEVLVLFTSQFYTETKPSTGKVVPTWDYTAVQAYGKATIYHDKSEEASSFLAKQIDDISLFMERNVAGHTSEGGRPKPWRVSDAPDNYIEILKKAIIGIEIKIERLEGVVKMSQDKQEGDRLGVIQGFKDMGTKLGDDMAEQVTKRHEIKKASRANAAA